MLGKGRIPMGSDLLPQGRLLLERDLMRWSRWMPRFQRFASNLPAFPAARAVRTDASCALDLSRGQAGRLSPTTLFATLTHEGIFFLTDGCPYPSVCGMCPLFFILSAV